MKKCLLCGHIEPTNPTCPKCGEATWGPAPLEAAPGPELELAEIDQSAPKRRGRPRKNAN